MPTTGDKITTVSYNAIRDTFINYLTTGVTGQPDTGYRQTASSAAVATGNKVKLSDWAALSTDIRKMANHQGTSVSLPDITTSTKISAAVANTIQTAATAVVQPGVLYNLAAGQFSDEFLISSQRTIDWNGTIRHNFSLSFADANNARYFFNTGSTIRITPGFVKSSATAINNEWETLINTLGTVVFGHTSTFATGASPGTGSSIGFHDLATFPQQIYTKIGTGVYNANDYTIRAFRDPTATVVYFECEFKDDKGPNPNFDEIVTGTVTNSVRMFRASGSYVAVNAPSVSASVNLQESNLIIY